MSLRLAQRRVASRLGHCWEEDAKSDCDEEVNEDEETVASRRDAMKNIRGYKVI